MKSRGAIRGSLGSARRVIAWSPLKREILRLADSLRMPMLIAWSETGGVGPLEPSTSSGQAFARDRRDKSRWLRFT